MTTTHIGALRSPASTGTSFRQQMWLLGASGRWIYPIAALVAMLMIIPGSDPATADPATAVAAALVAFLGAFWPMIVWYGETPSRRVYHWSLPVARAPHDLMRVAAGALYLVGMSAAIALAAILIDGNFTVAFDTRTILILAFGLVPLFPYFLMSALALWSDYAVTRYALAAFVGFGFGSAVLERVGYGVPADWLGTLFFGGSWAFAFTLLEGVFMLSERATSPGDTWPAAIAVWLATGIALTLLAVSVRPDDLRRRLARTPRASVPVAPQSPL